MKALKTLFLLAMTGLLTLAISCDPKDSVTGLSLDQASASVDVNGTLQLNATALPVNVKTSYLWSSDNTAIATVSGSGKTAVVTGKADGTAKITVKAGAFTASCTVKVGQGSGTGGDGDGSETSPYSVTQLLGFFEDGTNLNYKGVWVNGYIVGAVISDTNVTSVSEPSHVVFGTTNVRNTCVMIAASANETDYTKCAFIQLPSGSIRTTVNLVNNPTNLGKPLAIKGNMVRYFAQPGIQDATAHKIDVEVGGTGNGTKTNPYDVSAVQTGATGTKWTKGYIVGHVNGVSYDDAKIGVAAQSETEFLMAASASETDVNKCIPVQLPAGSIRTLLDPYQASVIGKSVLVYGSLESYFGVAGIRSVTYVELEGGSTAGTDPDDNTYDPTGAIFNETLLTETSFGKFTSFSVSGTQAWVYSATYGAMISGYNSDEERSYENEDWFISPAIDLTSASNLWFDHARGPAASINVGVSQGWYSVWVSKDYTSGNPTQATWTEIKGVVHGTAGWEFVKSGKLVIPAEYKTANVKIALKYQCSNSESATWEVKNFVVK